MLRFPIYVVTRYTCSWFTENWWAYKRKYLHFAADCMIFEMSINHQDVDICTDAHTYKHVPKYSTHAKRITPLFSFIDNHFIYPWFMWDMVSQDDFAILEWKFCVFCCTCLQNSHVYDKWSSMHYLEVLQIHQI